MHAQSQSLWLRRDVLECQIWVVILTVSICFEMSIFASEREKKETLCAGNSFINEEKEQQFVDTVGK